MTEDLTGVTWRVSSRSNSGGGNCVEVGALVDGSGLVAVRDSKDRTGPALVVPRTAWTAFLATVPR
jgi:hypothetical protein